MLRQIVEDLPLSFVDQGVPAWPELESVLRQALEKDPDRRYTSTFQFVEALRAVRPASDELIGTTGLSRFRLACDNLFAELDAENLSKVALPSGVPSAPIAYGAAGIAYALCAVACRRRNAEFLAAAQAWSAFAIRSMDWPGAFTSDEITITDDDIGPASLYYGRPGVFLVQALVSRAFGDDHRLGATIFDYLAACRVGDARLELTDGKAGLLIGCSLLLDACRKAVNSDYLDNSIGELKSLACQLLEDIWAMSPNQNPECTGYLGMAHGWAGKCYASLLWSEVAQQECPQVVRSVLAQLADMANEVGRGIHWPIRAKTNGYLTGWCHGAPGFVYLWTAACRVLRDTNYLCIAERAAWTCWDAESSMGSLCCGDTGRANALTHLYRHTGNRDWIVRAEELAARAVKRCLDDSKMRYSLYKGMLGAAVLLEDLGEVDTATFPLFETDRR